MNSPANTTARVPVPYGNSAGNPRMISGNDPTAQEQAYLHIKEEILTLRLRPNARLNAGALAGWLKISRTPVREALTRLEHEGLAIRQSGGGFTVIMLSLKDVNDIYRVREVLEVEAALEAMANVSDAWIAKVEGLFATCRTLLTEGRYADFVLTSRAIHSSIIELSGNTAFQMVMGPIVDRVRIIGAMLIDLYPPRSTEVLEENVAIITALKKRDRRAVAAATRAHVRSARKRAMELFTNESKHIYAGFSSPGSRLER